MKCAITQQLLSCAITQRMNKSAANTKKEYTLYIPGEPMAKARPRFTGKFVYTPAKTVNYEVLIKELFIEKYGSAMIDGYINANIAAYFSIPKSTSKKKRDGMIRGVILPTKKPDLDNIAKIILDSLNKIAFVDDSYVTRLSVEKYYSEKPRVEVFISEIN